MCFIWRWCLLRIRAVVDKLTLMLWKMIRVSNHLLLDFPRPQWGPPPPCHTTLPISFVSWTLYMTILLSTTICTTEASCSSVNSRVLPPRGRRLSVLQQQNSVQYRKHCSNTVYKVNLQNSIAPNLIHTVIRETLTLFPLPVCIGIYSLYCALCCSQSSREVRCLQNKPILILERPDDGCYGEAAQIGQHSLPSLSRPNHGSDWAALSVQPLSRSNHAWPHGPPQSPEFHQRVLFLFLFYLHPHLYLYLFLPSKMSKYLLYIKFLTLSKPNGTILVFF